MSEAPKTRWFVPTPAKLVALLLMVELCLLLVNRHSGWLCLAAVAAFLLTLLVLLVWFGIALLLRRRGRSYFQFTVVTPLLLMVCVAVVGGWFTWKRRCAKRQKEAVEAITKYHLTLGGRDYLSSWIRQRDWLLAGKQPTRLSLWFRRTLGNDFFGGPEEVTINGEFDDNTVAHLKCLPPLRTLEIHIPLDPVTEADLKRLKEFENLEQLFLWEYYETEEGFHRTEQSIARIKAMMPNCEVRLKLLWPADDEESPSGLGPE